MILPFSTQINDKPTYFVERIHKSLKSTYFNDSVGFSPAHVPKDFDFLMFPLLEPKHHTIREDKNDRWKAGTKIDFFINCRQKNMFRFAPVLPVVSVQEVFMTKRGNDLEITIAKVGSYIGSDDFYLYHDAKKELAINDGFDSLEEFNAYFLERINEQYTETGNSWFSGKIIHWTNLRY